MKTILTICSDSALKLPDDNVVSFSNFLMQRSATEYQKILKNYEVLSIEKFVGFLLKCRKEKSVQTLNNILECHIENIKKSDEDFFNLTGLLFKIFFDDNLCLESTIARFATKDSLENFFD